MSAELVCAHCHATISEARPVDPFAYCGSTFCDQRCAARWAFANMPRTSATAKEATHGLRRIHIYARGRGRELARATLNELRKLETS